jgi:hypothetical protein
MLHDVNKTSVSNQNHNFLFLVHSRMMMKMIQSTLHIIQGRGGSLQVMKKKEGGGGGDITAYLSALSM